MAKKLSEYNVSYNSCGICGRVPGHNQECNWAAVKWWDCDDAYKIGTICRWCHNEVKDDVPHPDDWAYHRRNDFPMIDTDEDPLEALME